MLRFKLRELIAEKSFKEDRHITLVEVAKACNVNRMTLSKMVNKKGYNTNSENIDKLCAYFECKVEDLVEYLPEA
ncbi:hypothetical protein PCNPT3_08285 [Psychromonas sp. CNPT3]|uniref:helix-turn-helix domain-containing protein n=1 Tax=Psychromonas sp. CNPT3 TaxID=314282 RepID=UPI0002C135D5|nr:helix-turn-helix transcriptional regulator [Psychromonas sp. CNPT3]AGH81595.1 hypothetical protein PCNPT3_08285 [Psychromonas sp. CNPT3]